MDISRCDESEVNQWSLPPCSIFNDSLRCFTKRVPCMVWSMPLESLFILEVLGNNQFIHSLEVTSYHNSTKLNAKKIL